MLRVDMVVIDPQNDFMGEDDIDPATGFPRAYSVQITNGPKLAASLPVKGAVSDMKRLSGVIDRVASKLSAIHVTLDSHRVIDIANPAMWRNSKGESPPPFTIILRADIENGLWYPRNPDPKLRQWVLDYTGELEAKGRYKLLIWPEHCIIGTWGHNVQTDVAASLQRWERKRLRSVDYVVKGTNSFTEHYGALQAEVPRADDPTTELNADFLEVMGEADMIGLAGEASSHCVLASIQQIADNIGDEHLKKFHILTDCMSPVGAVPTADFPAIATQFFADMAQRGMKLTTSAEFLA